MSAPNPKSGVEAKIEQLLMSANQLDVGWRVLNEAVAVALSSQRTCAPNSLIVQIDNAIKEAESMECLTSPQKYIRETKKWYLEHADSTVSTSSTED